MVLLSKLKIKLGWKIFLGVIMACLMALGVYFIIVNISLATMGGASCNNSNSSNIKLVEKSENFKLPKDTKTVYSKKHNPGFQDDGIGTYYIEFKFDSDFTPYLEQENLDSTGVSHKISFIDGKMDEEKEKYFLTGIKDVIEVPEDKCPNFDTPYKYYIADDYTVFIYYPSLNSLIYVKVRHYQN